MEGFHVTNKCAIKTSMKYSLDFSYLKDTTVVIKIHSSFFKSRATLYLWCLRQIPVQNYICIPGTLVVSFGYSNIL